MKIYPDWREALIQDLPTARPMCQPVFKQTSGQILATTYSGLYNTPMNKEISDIIDLSMNNSMDRVTRPWANTNEHTKQCFSEISGKKLVVHISCTVDDSTVDFTRNKTQEKQLFDIVWNMCWPGTDKKLKKIEIMWVSGNNWPSLAKRLTQPQSKMWNVQWVIFASGYIPKEGWEQLAQIFYSHYYSDPNRDVVQAYKSTRSQGISNNATNYSQLFSKNMDNDIVPARLRLAETTTKKLAKTQKEEMTPGVNDRLMSAHNKVPELKTVTGQSNNKRNYAKPSLMALLQRITSPMRWTTLTNRSLEMGNLPIPNLWPKAQTTWSLILNSMGIASME